MQVPTAYLLEKHSQRVLADSKRADQEPTILHRQIHRGPFFYLGLSGEGSRNPQPQAVTPLLNLRLHRTWTSCRIYNEYTRRGLRSSPGVAIGVSLTTLSFSAGSGQGEVPTAASGSWVRAGSPPAHFSTTWSARPSTDCGIGRPRALAVLSRDDTSMTQPGQSSLGSVPDPPRFERGPRPRNSLSGGGSEGGRSPPPSLTRARP